MWRAIFTIKYTISHCYELELVFFKYIIAIQYGTLLIFSLQNKKKIEEEEEERNHKQSFTLYWIWHLDHLIQYAKLFKRVILHVHHSDNFITYNLAHNTIYVIGLLMRMKNVSQHLL